MNRLSSPQVEDVLTAVARMGLNSHERLRVGWDVVSISEYSRLVDGIGGPAMLKRCFTEAELRYSAGRPERLAARWAAKEAVVKALGTGFRGISAAQIEILHDLGGEPSIAPVGAVAWPHRGHEWTWRLSITHEGDVAAALAVALSPDGCSFHKPRGRNLEMKEDGAEDDD